VITRRRFLTGSVIALTPIGATASAQEYKAGKVWRIGYLLLPPLAEKPTVERQALLEGLRELGYDDGRNVVIEYRSAAWNRELLPDLADELVDRKVDVILAVGPQATEAARDRTRSIPIVMIAEADPVTSGLVTSLARPGVNVTGFTLRVLGLAGKRLALLREAAPRASRILVIWNAGNPANVAEWNETREAAGTLKLPLESIEVRDADGFLSALPRLARRPPGAVKMITDTLTFTYREILADFTLKNRVPGIMASREFAEAGGLISYGPKTLDLFRRAAIQIDKIFRGARPADLPVEQPTTFELVINAKTAKALGLTIPPSLLARADQVIE
jgi:putative ABC transport system substrate-binding protein